jgi:hypothetical protein
MPTPTINNTAVSISFSAHVTVTKDMKIEVTP